jgi:hypothetical protein
MSDAAGSSYTGEIRTVLPARLAVWWFVHRLRRAERREARRAPFDVYAVEGAGRPFAVAADGATLDEGRIVGPDRVTVGHGRPRRTRHVALGAGPYLHVQTAQLRWLGGPAEHAREELNDMLDERRAEIAALPRTFLVDGVERSFAFAAREDAWCAVGVIDDVTVTITARRHDAEGVALRRRSPRRLR